MIFFELLSNNDILYKLVGEFNIWKENCIHKQQDNSSVTNVCAIIHSTTHMLLFKIIKIWWYFSSNT